EGLDHRLQRAVLGLDRHVVFGLVIVGHMNDLVLGKGQDVVGQIALFLNLLVDQILGVAVADHLGNAAAGRLFAVQVLQVFGGGNRRSLLKIGTRHNAHADRAVVLVGRGQAVVLQRLVLNRVRWHGQGVVAD